MKTKQNSRFSSSPKVPQNEKSTHENFVSAWFLGSGTQDVSVAVGRLLLILTVHSHCTQESREIPVLILVTDVQAIVHCVHLCHCQECPWEQALRPLPSMSTHIVGMSGLSNQAELGAVTPLQLTLPTPECHTIISQRAWAIRWTTTSPTAT